ncbi:MAG TPA: PDDEXK nuclease domain-containing protein [Sedimentisphaerales bacterium]|jgi:predicted nuclease of restriction endonuclease-like (RecB) superfamily|nr:PDDEXK nuclease domain-containing protein [Sedimentisphaerales bacterium]HNU28116.1 PDDEXK nuclease domain-containing protein [Sedimentisphaerales bacterium]
MNFDALVHTVATVHERFQTEAIKAVNTSLTLRNWMIGFFIKEYEQQGEDRAEYGARLVERLANQLGETLDRCYTPRYLRLCRQLYEAYPQIWKSLTAKSSTLPFRKSLISEIQSLLPSAYPMVATASPQLSLPASQILARLSFTHLIELLKIEDSLKRAFYEIECIKGNWSVRELARQIASLYYERSGLSRDKEALSRLAQETAEISTPAHIIRDPYVFEFLGLRAQEVLPESELEAALIGRLQDFLLELGRGFCFEARQKRLLIGDEHFFVDLVFYHRILKCHVLIELKVDGFKHEYLGQLNTYVTWFREHEMAESDNPPIGILLCTKKNHALVRYALAGMDNRLFVSKYELQLPDVAQIKTFLEEQYRQLQEGRRNESAEYAD